MNNSNTLIDTSKSIHVVCSSDKRYLPFLEVMLASLVDNISTNYKLMFYVINFDLSEKSKKRISSISKKKGICYFLTPDKTLKSENRYIQKICSMSPHYHRLLLEYLLPKQLHKVIYLDLDTIICDDLSKLWTMNADHHVILAVQDYLPTIKEGISNYTHFEKKFDSTAPYFNSGVMLINLQKWRAENISSKVIDCCIENKKYLLAEGKHPQYDQYGLNVILFGKWLKINESWNYGSEKANTEPKIIHFIGNGKPWSSTCKNLYRQFFLHYLKLTQWRESDFSKKFEEPLC